MNHWTRNGRLENILQGRPLTLTIGTRMSRIEAKIRKGSWDMDLEWRSVRSWPWHLWRSSFQPPPARPKMTKKRKANFIKAYSCLCPRSLQKVFKVYIAILHYEYIRIRNKILLGILYLFRRWAARAHMFSLCPRNRRISATASSISVPCKASCNTRRPRALPSMIFRERLRKTIEKIEIFGNPIYINLSLFARCWQKSTHFSTWRWRHIMKTHFEDMWRHLLWRHIVWWRRIFLWRHILALHCLAPHCLVTPHFPVTPHFGATLFGATLFGDATFSCDATFWRHILWRHIVWWRHIFLWRHILAPHSLATHCLVTPHWGVLRCIGGLEVGWNGLGWGLVVWRQKCTRCGVYFWEHGRTPPLQAK